MKIQEKIKASFLLPLSVDGEGKEQRDRGEAVRIIACCILVILFVSLSNAELLPLFPEENSYLTTQEFSVVAVSVLPSDSITSGIVGMKIDGQEVTPIIDSSGLLLTWQPDSTHPLIPGRHSVAILFAQSSDIIKKVIKEWSFTLLLPADSIINQRVANSANKNWGQNGRLYTEVDQSSYSSHNDFSAFGGGMYRGYAGNWHYGADAMMTTQNPKSGQDQNFYAADFGYGRVFNVKVGDIRPDFNPAILSGQRIRGVDGELHAINKKGSNPFNIEVAYGQASRAVAPVDSFSVGTYKRSLLAVRTSFGSGEHFQFGLMFLKGKDDTASLHRGRDSTMDSSTNTLKYYTDDAAGKDNVVVGADMVARMFKERVELFATYALSLYTRNINTGVISKSKLDSLLGGAPIDLETFSWLLIINTSTTPLYPSLQGFLSSSYLKAGAGLTLPFSTVSEYFRFAYELQGGNYVSMGNTSLGSPRKGFIFTDRIGILSNKAVLSVDYNWFDNNYDQIQRNPTITQNLATAITFCYSRQLPIVTLNYTVNTSNNADTAYGFKSGVNLFGASGSYWYEMLGTTGTVQLFAGITSITNSWRMNTFTDTTHLVGADTSLSFSSSVYGLNVRPTLNTIPLTLYGGIMTSAGSGSSVKLFTGSLGARYQIIPRILSLDAGAQIGSSTLPLDKSRLYSRFSYGADFYHRTGQQVRYEGYFVAQKTSDFVNRLKYEWRF